MIPSPLNKYTLLRKTTKHNNCKAKTPSGAAAPAEENHGLLSKTLRKNKHEFLNGLIQSHFCSKNCCHFSIPFKHLGERGEKLYLVTRKNQDKNLDSYVSCHLLVLMCYRLLTLVLFWMIPPVAVAWRAGDLSKLRVLERSSRSLTNDRSNPTLGSRCIC